jgi:uncharacterized membrane protein
MSLRRNAVVQIVFALLLLAQQGALTQHGKDAKKNRLCDLHSALGTVLGAVTGVVAVAPLAAASQPCFIASESPAASVSLLAPPSRGPPALS